MKALRIGFGLVFATLATLALGSFDIRGGPDLFLLPVAEAARGATPIPGMLVGLFSGLLEDAVATPDRMLGLHAFTKVLVGYLLATLGARMVVEKPVAVGALLGGTVLLESGILVLLIWALRGALLLPPPGPLALRVLTTAVLGGIVHAVSLVPWLERREARRRKRLTL